MNNVLIIGQTKCCLLKQFNSSALMVHEMHMLRLVLVVPDRSSIASPCCIRAIRKAVAGSPLGMVPEAGWQPQALGSA